MYPHCPVCCNVVLDISRSNRMIGSKYDPIPILCPHCEVRDIETTYRIFNTTEFKLGWATYVSCIPCAKSTLAEEAKKATASKQMRAGILISQFLHIIQIPLIRKDHRGVHEVLLKQIGLSKEQSNNIALLGTYLAVSMIKVDGNVVNHEVNVARDLGKLIFPEFDEHIFQKIVTQAEQLPPVNIIAQLLSNILPEQGKIAVFKYLSEISEADNEANFSEKILLIHVAEQLDIDPDEIELPL